MKEKLEKTVEKQDGFFNRMSDFQKVLAYTVLVVTTTISVLVYFNVRENKIKEQNKEVIRDVVREELSPIDSAMKAGFKQQINNMTGIEDKVDAQSNKVEALQNSYIKYLRDNTTQTVQFYQYIEGLILNNEKKNKTALTAYPGYSIQSTQ